ncbi:MAG: hypothetical protein C5B48_02565 [Candidatus Rokuibacteriota bacterium]|nr:MAG: hypothetical protein C5B48_02565 [Candidatus Rokubacteria bacterium]
MRSSRERPPPAAAGRPCAGPAWARAARVERAAPPAPSAPGEIPRHSSWPGRRPRRGRPPA